MGVYEELVDSCNYFCDLQSKVIASKVNQPDKLKALITNNLEEIYRRWDPFVSNVLKYIQKIVEYYNDQFKNLSDNLLGFTVTKTTSKKDTDSILNEMKSFVVLTYVINVELSYLESGLVPTENKNHFSTIEKNNKSKMDRKVELHKLYNFNHFVTKLDSLCKKSSNDDYSCLSLTGIEYLYFQLYNLIIWSGNKLNKKQFKEPSDDRNINFGNCSILIASLRTMNNIEFKNKDKSVFKKSLFMSKKDVNDHSTLSIYDVNYNYYYYYF